MNIKKKIQEIVANQKSDDKLLKLVSELKSKSFSDTKLYKNLAEIEHKLYRYNNLLKSNITGAAKEEGSQLIKLAQNLDDTETPVIKGGISNTLYIWRTEPNVCKTCQALDGKTFENKADIPEKPHPNCKCKIEEINVNLEECDCAEFFAELDSLSANIDAAKEDTDIIENFIKDAITLYTTGFTANLAYSVMGEIQTAQGAYHDFQKNKAEMIQFRENDKYHHAKANCEAVKRGLTGEMMAYILSYGKEVYDIFKKVIFDGMEFQRAWNDSLEDLRADKYGIQKGKENGKCEVNVKNVGDIFNFLP